MCKVLSKIRKPLKEIFFVDGNHLEDSAWNGSRRGWPHWTHWRLPHKILQWPNSTERGIGFSLVMATIPCHYYHRVSNGLECVLLYTLLPKVDWNRGWSLLLLCIQHKERRRKEKRIQECSIQLGKLNFLWVLQTYVTKIICVF